MEGHIDGFFVKNAIKGPIHRPYYSTVGYTGLRIYAFPYYIIVLMHNLDIIGITYSESTSADKQAKYPSFLRRLVHLFEIACQRTR